MAAGSGCVYTLATIWERTHVVHHLSECQPLAEPLCQTPDPVRDAA
jgi:hypothetical protein